MERQIRGRGEVFNTLDYKDNFGWDSKKQKLVYANEQGEILHVVDLSETDNLRVIDQRIEMGKAI